MKRFKMKVYLVFTLILGVFLLQGCGGDGGGGDWDGPAAIASITVTPVTAAIPVGGTQQFTAMATYVDGTTQNVTEDAGTVWTTVNLPASVATLSTNGVVGAGLATGVLSGTAEITATFDSMSDTATLTVNAATLVSVTVTPVTASVPVGGSRQFIAMASYSFGSDVDVTENAGTVWTTLPAGVAILSTSGVAGAGLATGAISGTADITATFGGQSDTATLTVNAAMLVSVTVTPVTASIPVGGTQQYLAMATYSFGPDVDVTENAATVWTTVSLPAGVATLSTSGVAGAGLATGAISGTADITATFRGQSNTAILTVNAATLVSITVTPVTASIPVGGTQQFLAMANYSFGPDVDVTENAVTVWTSANVPAGIPLVATLSPNGLAGAGLATGEVSGTAEITATFNLMSDTATLTVDPALAVVILPGDICPVAADLTIPTVTESNPIAGEPQATISTAGLLPEGKEITATFDMAMDFTSIESATSPLTFTIVETDSPLNSVSGVVTLDLLTSTIATFTTDNALLPETSYTASITVAAQSSAFVAIACPYQWDFTTGPAPVVIPPLAITLGTAESFGIVSRAGLTSTGVTVVNGDVALYPLDSCTDATGNSGASQSCLVQTYSSPTGMTVNGLIYWSTDSESGAKALAVTNDLTAAWVEGKAKVVTRGTVVANELASAIAYLPGVYSNPDLGLQAGGIATLDAEGDANAIFIFKVDSSFVDSGTLLQPTEIVLVNGAQARNVWFVVGLDATIGYGSTWNGNILAGRTTTVNSGSTVMGRILAGASGAGAFTITGAASPSVTTISVP